jgi:hypothetical protein
MFPFLVIRCGIGDSLIPFSFPGMDGLMLREFPSSAPIAEALNLRHELCARVRPMRVQRPFEGIGRNRDWL